MVNRVILVGRVVRDPEMNGTACKYTIVTSKKYTKKSGEKVDEPSFHRCVSFGKGGELIMQYVKKGSMLYVDGEIKYGDYENKDGNKVYTTDIIVNNFTFLPGGSDGGGTAGGSDDVPF